MTLEATRAVASADRVMSVVTDAPAFEMLRSYNPKTEDLTRLYALGKQRLETYHEMVEHVLAALREGLNVCFALYGHPLVFAYPSRVAAERAREEGFEVKVLPGISAEDCVFSELEIDPAAYGCQTYLADQLLEDARTWDAHSVLLIWQMSIIGESRCMQSGDRSDYQTLVTKLIERYGETHPAILYEAVLLPFLKSDIRRVTLKELMDLSLRACCTVVIPPLENPMLGRVPEGQNMVWVTCPTTAATK